MFRAAVPYLAISALVTFFSLGMQQVGLPTTSPLQPIVAWTWNSECGSGNCTNEESAEDWEDYSEECMQSTCSTEELSELAGGTAAISPMLQSYLGDGQVVMQASFQGNPSPPTNAVWWYTGCPTTGSQPTGMVAQTTSSSATMPNLPTSRNNSPSHINFANSTAAFTMGGSLTSVTIYTQASFVGPPSYQSATSIACLSQTAPPFANNVKSAQLAPTPPAKR